MLMRGLHSEVWSVRKKQPPSEHQMKFLVLILVSLLLIDCAAQIEHQSSYSKRSRASFQAALDEILKPNKEFVVGARAKLSEIFDDASLQGVQYVKIWSKISEVGFLTLGYLNAVKRFESFVGKLFNMDSTQFGTIFAATNYGLIANYDRQRDKVVCTFKELMASGKCSRNGEQFNVVEFRLPGNGQFNYEFRTLEKLSIEESEDNIYNNLHLTNDDVPAYTMLAGTALAALREYLYDHLDASKMFKFKVFFDGKVQPKYSEQGQGEYVSKVLHWELPFKQLYYELVGNNFTIVSSTINGFEMGRMSSFSTNMSIFQGYPSGFSRAYGELERSYASTVSLLQPQGIELRLWESVNNDFLISMKNSEWAMAGLEH